MGCCDIVGLGMALFRGYVEILRALTKSTQHPSNPKVPGLARALKSPARLGGPPAIFLLGSPPSWMAQVLLGLQAFLEDA